MESCLWYLRDLRFFPPMSPAEEEDLARRSEMVEIRRGDLITVRTTQEGQACLIKKGRLRALRRQGGRTVALDILGPGDIVGATTVLSGDADAEQAEALEDVLLCRIPARVLRELLENNPSASLHIGKLVGLRKRRVESRLIDMVFCSVRVRLAKLLIELSERYGQTHERGTMLSLKLTHQELSSLIGANREATTRAIGELMDGGAIAYAGRKLVILHGGGLAEISQSR